MIMKLFPQEIAIILFSFESKSIKIRVVRSEARTTAKRGPQRASFDSIDNIREIILFRMRFNDSCLKSSNQMF